jgi:ABC-type transport system involved in multi-copper enzyme maturation permease subunit
MSALALQIGAQVGAEVRTRLRSTGTMIALMVMLVGAYLWIPTPGGKATSISWQLADGRLQTSVHSAAYIGSAMSFLAGFFAVAIGFYLVAGSIRRDRERRVGAILAATPLPNAAYLLGKYFSHVAYLALVVSLIVPIGVYHFLRFGVGPFDALAFFGPLVLLTLPGIAFVAAMAVLFDVTPGLSGRMGLVIWFFVLSIVAAALPIAQATNLATGKTDRMPVFDPMGGTSVAVLIARSLPQAVPGSISTGLIFRKEVVPAVAWKGLPIDARFIAIRLAGVLWALPPLGLALLLFDRFDPARRRLTLRRKAKSVEAPEAPVLLDPAAPAVASSAAVSSTVSPTASFAALAAVTARPSAFLAIVADAVLLWKTGSILRWAVVLLVILAAFLPAAAAPMVGGGFLLLLAPLISEASCREALAGAGPLVFSQPGVPRSGTLWKIGSVSLFVVAVSLPFLLRALFTSPARGFAALSGLLFVAALAVSFGLLTGGGKLFVGIYLALWYAALNRVPYLDFCSLFGGDLGPAVRAAYLAAGAAFVALSMAVESRRRVAGNR